MVSSISYERFDLSLRLIESKVITFQISFPFSFCQMHVWVNIRLSIMIFCGILDTPKLGKKLQNYLKTFIESAHR